MPDPGEVRPRGERAAARRALAIPGSAPIIRVYGGPDARTNVGPSLRAAMQAQTAPVVILAGVVGAEVYALARESEWQSLEAAGRLVIENGFITLAREAQLFSAADLAWVGYRADFNGHSAVIPQAASVGVPVLGRRGGLIGTTIDQHQLGLTVDPQDTAQVAAAIDRLIADQRGCRYDEALARFAQSRSHAAYGEAWLQALGAWSTSVGHWRQWNASTTLTRAAVIGTPPQP